MNNAAQAYARVAKTTASPREMESQLLLRAASKLQLVEKGTVVDKKEITDALRFNRRLWTLLITSITSHDNPLPIDLKQNLANIASFIFSQTLSAEAKFDVSKLTPLISINYNIAAGLRGTGNPQADLA
jgi:flagellar protein FlaF